MAISMSNYEIDNSRRDRIDSLKYEEIASSIKAGSKEFAGISSTFYSSFSTAINSYAKSVETEVDKLTSLKSNGAINGTNIEEAIESFISSVKFLCSDWITELKEAEKAIILQVSTAYTQQDIKLASNVSSDKATVENQKLSS